MVLYILGTLTSSAFVTIQNVSLQTLPAYSCSTNVIDVTGQLGGANYTFVANNITVTGSTIDIVVEYSVGGIVLPAITSFTQNVTLPSLSAGSYTVNVTGKLNATIYNTITYPLTVTACCGAEAIFSVLSSASCVGDFNGVNNTSTGATTQDWYLNGNYVTSVANWQTDTLSPGTHFIKLVVSNGICSDSATGFLGVYAAPVINSITPSAGQICQGDLLDISAVTSNATTYTWSLDGTTNISTFEQLSYLVSTSPGSHNFELLAQNPGCPSVTTDEDIVVLASPDAGQINPMDTTICLGETLDFTSTSTASSVTEEWSLDGTSMSTSATFTHTFSNVGNYNVAYEIQATNGCSDSVAATVTVNDGPVINPIADTNVCDGAVIIDAGSGYSSYQWNTGDNTQTTTADTAGIYTCTVSNGSGCEAIVEVEVTDCASTENALNLDWNVYPNPTSGMINIQSSKNQITYVVYDLVGNKIAEGQSKEINMIDYPSGTYLIELQNPEGLLKTFRIVKK